MRFIVGPSQVPGILPFVGLGHEGIFCQNVSRIVKVVKWSWWSSLGQVGSLNVVGTGAIAWDGRERDVCRGVAVAIQSDPFVEISRQNGIPQVGALVKRIG